MPDEYIVVWLEEEYGYRHWRWEPGMTATELVNWWKNLKTVGLYFFSPTGLPGKVVHIDWSDMPSRKSIVWRAHLHEDEDSYLVTPGGKHIHHAGYRDYEV